MISQVTHKEFPTVPSHSLQSLIQWLWYLLLNMEYYPYLLSKARLEFQTNHLVMTFSSARMSQFSLSAQIQQLMGATVSVLHFLFRYMECKTPSQSVLWSHHLIHTDFSIPTESKWPLSHCCCLSMSIF